ncbi:photosystem II protein K [Populus alba x Populus x berolinensis]|uniref:Photosystem II protein K n=1 Tax=Populus alba x Populus x berolinensis TaxID=444605 RepID=A0AAD6LUV5_9ROSI|nr:photosystem II protein K [Populus alba x Populus x berolinensis]KAJ6973755.1 photosystem II protein K [Populus alba x Populus x berolinensis]
MFVMLNILNLICICFNFAFYSSSFFFTKLPKAYVFLNPIIDVMLIITLFSFLLAFVWQVAISFRRDFEYYSRIIHDLFKIKNSNN